MTVLAEAVRPDRWCTAVEARATARRGGTRRCRPDPPGAPVHDPAVPPAGDSPAGVELFGRQVVGVAGRVLRVAVSGAAGRMGRASVRAVLREPDLRLVAALGRQQGVGRDAGEVAGVRPAGVPIVADPEAVWAAAPDVLVEFTPGAPAAAHARAALERGIRPVIGSTGLGAQDLEALRALAAERRVGAVVAPNFALGAVLMMEFARIAGRFFPHVEIIELHHDRKRDAPSGTALKTARLVAESRPAAPAPAAAEEELVPGARGGVADGVRVHSVRLPGLHAHQEVLFGGPGQVLTLRHDSLGEESFMPGLLLAVRRVGELDGLVHGLEHLLDLR